jgi:hypothetical protein
MRTDRGPSIAAKAIGKTSARKRLQEAYRRHLLASRELGRVPVTVHDFIANADSILELEDLTNSHDGGKYTNG